MIALIQLHSMGIVIFIVVVESISQSPVLTSELHVELAQLALERTKSQEGLHIA
jgi:hypothetical protein